jgi:hypothetical protein
MFRAQVACPVASTAAKTVTKRARPGLALGSDGNMYDKVHSSTGWQHISNPGVKLNGW